jgi:mannose-6-phosphate isomerase-like protein (cupin superfamily)
VILVKLFNIRDLYREKYREYIVGSEEIQKHSVYLVYGEVSSGEKREMAPNGHDEILFLLSGDAKLENKDKKITQKKEQAVYIGPDEAFTFIAMSDCKYIVAGTHTTTHHDH